jgi:hypoxanthine phosphoribosyltransferase
LSPITPDQAWEVLRNADRLYAPADVEAALDRMAGAIEAKLAHSNPLFVCIMTGAAVPFGKLLPRLQFPLETDFVHATRYGDKLRGGELRWRVEPAHSAKERTVVLVDDILDEGETLAAIEARYRNEGAKEVYKAVLVVKRRSRTAQVAVDFEGLQVPNRYVFGYGMDYKGYLRNAPGIFAEAESE